MNVWSQLLSRLEQVIDRADYDNWLSRTRFLAQKSDTLDIGVPSQRHIDEIRERFGGQIRSLLNELSPERIQVHFVVAGDDLSFVPAPIPVNNDIPVAVFNPRYKFDSFVVGNSNQLAYAAALSIAENPSGSFNPLFIYGGSGLGKTHLIQAIGQKLRERHPAIKVVYMSAENFVTELITSIRYDRMAPFREKYRSVDALLLDDIQSIAGKERTQEEFFHTFNALYESQKQIVFTSDRPPREITPLEERLRSRFEWGLTADIQPPDLETKIAILRKKAEERRVDLSHDVAMFLAERVRNIRELEGNLNRVIVFASLAGQSITVDVVKEALKDVLSKENKPITVNEITKVVAAQYGLKSNDLRSKTNAQTIVFPRQVAMYLCKELTDLSYPEIGKQFNNKHHSTVMHSVEKITRLVESDSGLANVIEILTKQLR
ncbi:MAG TPA: chromosomal replication initiator protein DnaA [Thermoanaerobaculia bacterium]|nr:chromosomal replication initiator protein DnaA [Thermoanaerobaculia bacterium]